MGELKKDIGPSNLPDMLEKYLKNCELKIKELNYTMDFGSHTAKVTISLN